MSVVSKMTSKEEFTHGRVLRRGMQYMIDVGMRKGREQGSMHQIKSELWI